MNAIWAVSTVNAEYVRIWLVSTEPEHVVHESVRMAGKYKRAGAL